jgi:hypothetical protein
MWVKVVEVKKSFLHFLTNYDPHQVHNMLAIMIDLHSKSSQVVENYVGHDDAFYFTSKYNAKVVIFFTNHSL